MAERPEVQAPYPGLRPFERHEAEIFFGREQHVDRLLEILQREHFLAVIGPSGSGKSSLVRAGLLPALAAGWLGTGSNWRMAVLHPGDRPHRNLALALLEPTVLGPALASGDDESSDVALIHAELNRGPLGLVHLVGDAVQSGRVAETTQLLVLVDQFEEIFR